MTDAEVLAGDKAIAAWLSARGYSASERTVRRLRQRERRPLPSSSLTGRVLVRAETLRRWLDEEVARPLVA